MLGTAGAERKISCGNASAYNGLKDLSTIQALEMGRAVAATRTYESRDLSVKINQQHS
jgi:hypothetical protein